MAKRQPYDHEIKIQKLQDMCSDMLNKSVVVKFGTKNKKERHTTTSVLLGIAPLPVTGAKLALKPRDNKMPKVVKMAFDGFDLIYVIDDMQMFVITDGVMLETDMTECKITSA